MKGSKLKTMFARSVFLTQWCFEILRNLSNMLTNTLYNYTYSRVIILFAKKIFSDPTPWLTLQSNKFIKCFFCFKNFLNFLLRIGVLDYWAFTWSILDNLMANKKVLLQSRSLIIRMAIVLRSLTKWPSLIAKKETRSDCLSLIGDYSCLGCGCQIFNSNQFKDHVSLKVPKVR